MKKGLLFFLLFGWFCGVYGQQNYLIELRFDGVSLKPAEVIDKADIRWSMRRVSDNYIVSGTQANYTLWHAAQGLVLIIDLTDFPGYEAGDQIEVGVSVATRSSRFYKYTGRKVYDIDQTTGPEAFYGVKGINLRPQPTIWVNDTTMCKMKGAILPALVKNPPAGGYQIRWSAPWLRGIEGDRALLDSVPEAENQLTLSAILLDRQQQPLDTAIFTVTFDGLPEVKITESGFCCLPGQMYTVNGVVSPDCDVSWNGSSELRQRSVPTSYTAQMQDYNAKIVLTGTSKTNGCKNSDSIYVFLSPQKPVIKIDTNTNRNDLRIFWEQDTNVMRYVLMANSGDAYGIEKPYAEKQRFDRKTMEYTLNTSALDTLEFFLPDCRSGYRWCECLSIRHKRYRWLL